MMLTPDRQRIKSLLCETITMLCKNGLHYEQEFRIDALIGITIDKEEVFLITVNEFVSQNDEFILRSKKKPTECEVDMDVCKLSARRRSLVLPEPLETPADDQRSDSAAFASYDYSQSISQHGSEHSSASSASVPVELAARDLSADGSMKVRSCNNDASLDDEGFPGNDTQSSKAVIGGHQQHEVHNSNLMSRAATARCNPDVDDNSDDAIFVKLEPGEPQSSSTESNALVPSSRLFPSDRFTSVLNPFHSGSYSNTHHLSNRHNQNFSSGYSDGRCGFMPGFHLPTNGFNPNDRLGNCSSDDSQNDAKAACSVPDEYSDELIGHRRRRSSFAPHQIAELELAFSKSHYLTWEMRAALAAKLQLSHTVIGIWFQNRRQRLKNNVHRLYSNWDGVAKK